MATLRARLHLRSGSSSLSTSPSHSAFFSLTPSSPPHSSSGPQPSDSAPSSTHSPLPTRPSGPMHSSKKSFQNLGLHSGAAFGNLGLVKFALDNGQPIDSTINGVQPIHAACCNNANVPVVLFLVERGADVNARRCPRKYSGEKVVGSQTVGTTGSTPLHFAAANGCITIVETLLRHGATADLADKYGSTPYSVAFARGHQEIASILHQHACMQRGLQVITPDADYKDSKERDSYTSPRTSGDFGRRVSAIMTPTRSSTQQSEISSQSPASPPHVPSAITTAATAAIAAVAAAAASASARLVHQRRVSLPSIVEAPSSPVMTAAPRQSCDLSRVPLLNEPLDPQSDSANFRVLKPSLQGQASGQSQKKSGDKQQRLKSTQSTLPSLAKASESSSSGTPRRRSVDITTTGHLSPPAARTIQRHASFDQLAAMRPMENKIRRNSDASNSETVVSSPSSCSTLGSPIMQSGNVSRTCLDVKSLQETLNSQIQDETCPMTRSTSQPPMSPAASSSSARRASTASEPNVRRSFDIRLFSPSRDHALSETEDENKKGKGYKGYRRRSIQEPWAGKDHEDRISFLRSVKMTPSESDTSFRESSKSSKHRPSFSGSATISGRFSRIWSHYNSGKDIHEEAAFHDKHGSTGSTGSFGSGGSDGMWTTDELNALNKDDVVVGGVKSRAGMMNRLSGMWTRR